MKICANCKYYHYNQYIDYGSSICSRPKKKKIDKVTGRDITIQQLCRIERTLLEMIFNNGCGPWGRHYEERR